jgi:hypothetical protein
MRSTILAMVLSASCTLGVAACKEPAQGAPQKSAPTSRPASFGNTGTFAGTVLETMDAGGYTYLKLSTPEGERWAAVSLAEVKVGDPVTIMNATVMNDFEAKSLGRMFDQIIFGNLGGSMPSFPQGGKRSENVQNIGPIPKSAGADGRTVAEVWAERVPLKDKPVSLRGKVVKFNPNILGKNWMHLQDGTGTQEASNFDLTVTTNDEAKVGDVVVVRGVVHVDKDFGAGYSYPVLVEDAKIEK